MPDHPPTAPVPPLPEPLPPPATGIRAQIPNALTILRLVLAGVFFGLLEVNLVHRPPAWRLAEGVPNPAPTLPAWVLLTAAGLFVVAAATDALDGHLARKWNAISKFGRIMDPFADKILVLGAFVYLASPAFGVIDIVSYPEARLVPLSGVAPWMVVAIVARELLVTSVRGFFESQGVDFSADIAGKLKMVLQSVVIPLVLVLVALGDHSPWSPTRVVITLSVWLTVLVTLASCAPYVVKGIRSGRGLIHQP